MAIEYTWDIDRLDCYPEVYGQANVVFLVYWRAGAIDGDYSTTRGGSTQVAYVANGSFTPYDQLSSGQVLSWVQSDLGEKQIADIEASLAANIANQIMPLIASPPLPWIA